MPYWRLAVEKAHGNHTLMLGTFGLNGSVMPGGTYTDPNTGLEATHPLVKPGDHYTDVAADAQYQYIGEKHIITGTLTYIHEGLSLDATHAFGNSDNPSLELHSFKGSLSYIYQRTIGARATFQTMRGSGDSTYWGSGPRATTFTGEVFATPWLNTKLGVQYTAYADFDGDSANAGDNNTVYAYLWLAF